jgi:hypothetical protein
VKKSGIDAKLAYFLIPRKKIPAQCRTDEQVLFFDDG